MSLRSTDAINERQLLDQFLAALHALPEVTAARSKETPVVSGWPCDAWIDVQVAGMAFSLFVEVKKNSYPRDVRQALWYLTKLGRTVDPESNAPELIPVLVAESISPGAKELLRNERVGYFDSGGSLFVPARGLYIHVDKPPPKRFTRSVRSLFSGRRAQVLHALLLEHPNWFRVHELAANAHVSPTTASEVLIELERLEWARSRGRGPNKQRWLDEPARLLDAWAEQLPSVRPPRTSRYYVPLTQADELVEQIAVAFRAHQLDYAITGEAAGQHYAPFLSHLSRVHCRIPIGSTPDDALHALGARAVDEGANLVVLEFPSPGELLFRELVNGIWFASPVHVYLDLLRGKGRGRELAQHLRNERIGF